MRFILVLTTEPKADDIEDRVELGVTVILSVEIVLRFLSDWRGFRRSKQNWADLALVVITCIIQLPPIHNSGRVYEWLTLFQILRVYRVVWAIPATRNLLVSFIWYFDRFCANNEHLSSRKLLVTCLD